MARPIGSKNSPKSPMFAFKSSEDRAYFVRTNLPVDAEYSVSSQASLYNNNVQWYYLKVNLTSPKLEEK